MEISALLHRPESEYAYLYTLDTMHLRMRTKKNDVYEIGVIHGDPYLMTEEKWNLAKPTPMQKVATTLHHDYWQVSVAAPFNRLCYAFIVVGMDGEKVIYGDNGSVPFSTAELEVGSHYFKLPYFHEVDRVKTPDWVKGTVWYQIFPERFANGNPKLSPENVLEWESKEHPERTDFFGGDLQGVLDHLDYLQQLGVNGLYFCPIFEAATNHKYDTVDYMEIDRHFGDKALFKQLVNEAHRRGMKIMLDAVFNHIGSSSKQWLDVLEHQEQSRYKDWFHILKFPVGQTEIVDIENTKGLEYETFSFSSNMPKLNTANHEVQEHLLNIATYWIKEFHIDAWRLDVANEVDHQFWKKFYMATTQINPDIYILGEIWHSSQSWLNGDEFHAVMNYAFTDSIKECIVKQNIASEIMLSRLSSQRMLYRQQTSEVMFNLLDSHDTARILTEAHNHKNRVKCAFAFMFLQQGTPCIYYGTEVGMTGENDPDCRKPMWWNKERQDKDMFQFMQHLIAFRKQYTDVIGKGDLVRYDLDEETQVVSVYRQNHEQILKGTFNLGDKVVSITETGQDLLSCQMKNGQLQPYEFKIEKCNPNK